MVHALIQWVTRASLVQVFPQVKDGVNRVDAFYSRDSRLDITQAVTELMGFRSRGALIGLLGFWNNGPSDQWHSTFTCFGEGCYGVSSFLPVCCLDKDTWPVFQLADGYVDDEKILFWVNCHLKTLSAEIQIKNISSFAKQCHTLDFSAAG